MSRIAPYVVAAALAAAFALALRGRDPAAAPPLLAPPGPPAHATLPPTPSDSSAADARADLPPVLRDTEVDGGLFADSRGDLVVSTDVRRFFDWFLIASNDFSPDSLRRRAAAEIERRLAPKAAAQAIALFDRYLEYRRRAGALDTGGSDYEARLTALWALRREVIGTRDAVALFGDDEDSVRAALDRSRVGTDPRLSEAEKERKLAEINARLPTAERESRAEAAHVANLFAGERELRERGGSAEELRRLREASVGPEAADRLEALDRERAEFQRQVQALRTEQAALEADASLTADERTVILLRSIDERVPAPERTHARILLGLL